MSNHYHVVLRVNAEQATAWIHDEVLHRWTQLFKGPEPVRMYLAGEDLSPAESDEVSRVAGIWRERLAWIQLARTRARALPRRGATTREHTPDRALRAAEHRRDIGYMHALSALVEYHECVLPLEHWGPPELVLSANS